MRVTDRNPYATDEMVGKEILQHAINYLDEQVGIAVHEEDDDERSQTCQKAANFLEQIRDMPDLAELLLGGPGHDGYAYNADVYCVNCGEDIIRDLYTELKYINGDNGDSNEFPQPIFFGESPDCPQHCGNCGEYMYGEENEEEEDEEL